MTDCSASPNLQDTAPHFHARSVTVILTDCEKTQRDLKELEYEDKNDQNPMAATSWAAVTAKVSGNIV